MATQMKSDEDCVTKWAAIERVVSETKGGEEMLLTMRK